MGHINSRLIGILRTRPKTEVKNAIYALELAFSLGAEAVEITSNSDGWEKVVDNCSNKGLYIGVGSIKSGALAKQAINCGAKFLVCPGLFEDAIAVANEYKIPVLPGVYHWNEATHAVDLGILDVKFFPASVTSHESLYKAVQEPFRDEFNLLEKEGWKIIPYNGKVKTEKAIQITSPTEFYKQYLEIQLTKKPPLYPIVIGLPSGEVGFDRLRAFSDRLENDNIRVYAVGGINFKNINEVLIRYGAYGVCPGKGFFDPDAIQNGDFEKVKNDVKQHLTKVKEFELAWNTYVN